MLNRVGFGSVFGLMIARCCLSLPCAIALALPTHAQSTPQAKPDFAPVREFIERQIVEEGIPSMAVAVSRQGEILWDQGFGWADRENRKPANEHTMYQVASVTKVVTGTAVMVLQEHKQVDIERPVNDYLGSAKLHSPLWDPEQATVRRVATHTAGLATYDDRCRVEGPECQDEMIRRYGTIIWRPGDHFDYSNLGYGVLSEMIAHVSGRSYADFVRDQVFWPLDMTHCSVGVGPGLEDYAAVHYTAAGERIVWNKHDDASAEGASSVYCSAHDLVQLGMFHLKQHLPRQKAILTDSNIDAIQNSAVVAFRQYRYGFGWWRIDRFGYSIPYVGGGNSFATAFLYTVPSEGIAVAVLANTSTTVPQAVVDRILSALLPPYAHGLAKAGGGEQKPSAKPNQMSSIVGTWTGAVQTYKGTVPLTLSILESGDVHAKLGDQLTTLLDKAYFGQEKGVLSGFMLGSLGIDKEQVYKLEFELYLAGDEFHGGVTTHPLPAANGVLATYWVDLKKDQPKKP